MRILLFMLFFICTSPTYSQSDNQQLPPSESPLLPWTMDFDQALQLAKTQSRPIYLYISGSAWCIWCKKMDKEIHNQDIFRQKMVGKFIFAHLDLPAGSAPSQRAQEVLNKYHAKGVPSVIILSPEGTEIARFRYRQISPEEYANIVIEASGTNIPKLEQPAAK